MYLTFKLRKTRKFKLNQKDNVNLAEEISCKTLKGQRDRRRKDHLRINPIKRRSITGKATVYV